MVYPYQIGETSVNFILCIINGCWVVLFIPFCIGFLNDAIFMISDLDLIETIFIILGIIFFIAINVLGIFIKLFIKKVNKKPLFFL